MESKIRYKSMYLQNKNGLTDRTDLWLPRGREDRGGKEWDFGSIRVKLLDIG